MIFIPLLFVMLGSLFVAWLVMLIISKDVPRFLLRSLSIVFKFIAFLVLATLILYIIFSLLS